VLFPLAFGLEGIRRHASCPAVVPTKKTPVARYHDQRKALKAVAYLAMGCSECGITRDRSAGPEFLAFFAGLSWSKLWSHGGCFLGEGLTESRLALRDQMSLSLSL